MEQYLLILDTLTAFGTVGATIVALWLGLRDNKQKIVGLFVWSATTNYQPTLLIQNTGKRVVVIESVEVFYDRKSIAHINFFEINSLRNFTIIEANQVVQCPINSDWLKFNLGKNLEDEKRRTLKIKIKTQRFFRYTTTQKYSHYDLTHLLFGEGLFESEKG